MKRAVVTAAHEVPSRAPLRLSLGERVRIGRRDTEWPTFLFVTAASGEGWVPERCLDVAGEVATVVAAYDTTELATASGDVLDVIEDDAASGWAWCRDAAGREGWVPWRTLSATLKE